MIRWIHGSRSGKRKQGVSAIDEFIVDLPNNDFAVKFDGTPEKLQSIVTDKFHFELSLALEFDIKAFLKKSGMTREEFEVIAANALMLAEQNGGIKTYPKNKKQ